jgi:myosin-light-chain kinase
MLKSEENRDIIIYEPKIKQECIKEPNNISSNSTVENSKKNKNEMCVKNEEIINLKKIIQECYSKIQENYEIMNNIEKGGESIVTKIRHKKSKIELTLKYINNKKKYNTNELKIASKLKNKNIIRFISYCNSPKDNSEIFLMENAKFGNLTYFMKNSLKRWVLSESMMCYFTNEILKALIYCHVNKVPHIDIKPQNIVLDEYMNAKLIDFSISIDYKYKKSKEKIKLPFKGTKPYMSLEILKQECIEYVDINKIDSYELGVMIYFLVFGSFPYDIKYGDDYNKIKEKIENNELEIKNKNQFSKYLIDFIEKLLKKNIKERMSIFEAVNHYWVKGGKLLYDEKEKTYNIYSFATQLMTDGVKEFNDYLNM